MGNITPCLNSSSYIIKEPQYLAAYAIRHIFATTPGQSLFFEDERGSLLKIIAQVSHQKDECAYALQSAIQQEFDRLFKKSYQVNCKAIASDHRHYKVQINVIDATTPLDSPSNLGSILGDFFIIIDPDKEEYKYEVNGQTFKLQQ